MYCLNQENLTQSHTSQAFTKLAVISVLINNSQFSFVCLSSSSIRILVHMVQSGLLPLCGTRHNQNAAASQLRLQAGHLALSVSGERQRVPLQGFPSIRSTHLQAISGESGCRHPQA